MKRIVNLKKQYDDVALLNVFEPIKSNGTTTLNKSILDLVSAAKETVCITLGNGMNGTIARVLSSVKARVYVLVPRIDEKAYKQLCGKIIAREVPNIQGNYCLIDDKALLLFDEAMNGVVVKSKDAISTVRNIFVREFWEIASEEFIETNRPCAERTFDIPPVNSCDDVIIDDGFGETTELKRLIDSAKTVAYTGKISTNTNGNIIINNIKENSDYLKKVPSKNISFYPVLPFCYVISSDGTYALNFDIAKYEELSLAGKGRLFAVKIDDVNFGDYYKFSKHKTIGELVGQTVIDSDDNKIEVKNTAKEIRSTTVDLSLARELKRMESNREDLEASLKKIDSRITDTDQTASEVLFNVELKIKSQSYSKKADVYEQFKKANKDYTSKINEVIHAVEKSIDKHLKNELDTLKTAPFTTAKDYQIAVETLNTFIDEKINNKDALGEILGSKKASKSIAKLEVAKITMDIPKFGELYQQKNKYEYVLKSANDLDSAINEMKKAGIEQANVAYLEEK